MKDKLTLFKDYKSIEKIQSNTFFVGNSIHNNKDDCDYHVNKPNFLTINFFYQRKFYTRSLDLIDTQFKIEFQTSKTQIASSKVAH